MTDTPCIFPTFRYRDASAALDWLVGTVGFVVRMRSPATGAPDHAELVLGPSVIMVGQHRDDAFARIVGLPGTSGGSAVYLAVRDVNKLFGKVAASGVRIEQGLTDRPYGSREFICRDPGGYVWCFGTYLSAG